MNDILINVSKHVLNAKRIFTNKKHYLHGTLNCVDFQDHHRPNLGRINISRRLRVLQQRHFEFFRRRVNGGDFVRVKRVTCQTTVRRIRQLLHRQPTVSLRNIELLLYCVTYRVFLLVIPGLTLGIFFFAQFIFRL